MSVQGITSLIDDLRARRVLLLCHVNADPDAVCAAYALSRLLTRLRPEVTVEVAAPQGPSRLSERILETLPMELTAQPRIEDADLIVLLDTNTTQQLGEWAERVKASPSPIVVIDHHAGHPETERLATLSVADEGASSTCEIVHRLFKEAGAGLEEAEARALFLGLAFDTKHFAAAGSGAFKTVAELVDAGVNAEEALSLLSLPMDPSERVARLKACQRAEVRRIGEWVTAFSHVSAYQASAARALIGLGAHVAVVAGRKGEALQVSLRSSRDFHEKTGLHLGRDVAKPLGEYLHGTGGGHATAAGVNGVGDIKEALERCFGLLRSGLQ